jgi:parallel beta-helix repeat protein
MLSCAHFHKAFFALVLIGASAASASAATLCVNHGGTSGCWSTIGAAVAAAAPGDTITVAASTYNEDVHITKSLALVGDPFNPPTIDAAGKNNGIFVDGMAAAPLAGIANVTVYGFKVEHANYEGILVANGNNITITGNHVLNNNKALKPGETACAGIPSFETSEAMDCGEGIHVISSNHSSLVRNLVEDNSGGILITDETGPTSDNLVDGNVVHDNGYACGITLASHPNAIGGLPFGITHNTIANNQSYHNGLLLPGAGAGVGIFAPGPGNSNTANVVTGNTLWGNGLPGVTMHIHGYNVMAPPVSLNDNVIIGNHIHGNAADTADAHTPGTTGINIYSAAPITGIVIANNDFSDESIDIAFSAPAGYITAHFNDFDAAGTGILNQGSGWVDATENWWNSATGPSPSSATTSGPSINTIPWLPAAYNSY